MRIAIRTHDLGVRQEEPLLERLHALGINAVQLVCYKAFDDVLYEKGGITEARATEIGRAFSEAGVSVPLIGAYFNPVHSDLVKRQRGYDVFLDYIRFAKRLGGSIVGSETGSYNDDKWTYHPQNRTEEARIRVADTFRSLCDKAAESGVCVGIEGASGHVCYSVAALRETIQRIGRTNLRVIFDLYNFLDESNAARYLDILDEGLDAFSDSICCYHIKDCRFTDGKPVQVGVGRGDLDLSAVLGRIKRHDPDAVLTLEGTVGEDIPFAVQTINHIWSEV